jgi:hypothetical protein
VAGPVSSRTATAIREDVRVASVLTSLRRMPASSVSSGRIPVSVLFREAAAAGAGHR